MTAAALPALPQPPLPAPRLPGSSWDHLLAMRNDPLAMMRDARRQCGDLAEVRFGPRRALVLSAPRHVEHVLVRHADRWGKGTRGQQILRRVLGQGLLTAEGETWRRNRRIANPAFARRAIGGFAATMQQASDDLAETWAADADGRTERDAAVDMNHLALRIAGETLFGQDVQAAEDAVSHGLDIVLEDFLRLTTLPHPALMQLPTPRNLKLRRALRGLDEVVHGIIAERRASEIEHADLLGMLMAAEDEDGGTMSDQQLRDEVLTMLLAGHETTANNLAWSLYLLGRHPTVQEALAAELREGELDLRGGGLLHQVLQESLRLHPPAWIISRAAVEEDEIDGLPVPAGTFAFLSPYVLHRHPDVWPHPEAFLPQRWADGDRPLGVGGQPISRWAFVPFGAGQRKCIGSHFADMEARIALATLIKRFRVTLVAGHAVEPQASVTLRPGNGVRITLQPRSDQADRVFRRIG